MTSWLVEDFIEVNDSFGAQACLITSASSKTSIALGHSVKSRGKLASIGLTSPSNVAFCEGLGCYDQVLSYDQYASLDAASPVLVVDMAGSAQVLSDLHHHFGDNMKHSCRVGATHYDEGGSTDGLPGAEPQFFFAPGHIQSRSKELGASTLMMQLGGAYVQFRQYCDGWLTIDRHNGEQAFSDTYQAVLSGKADPAVGQIVSMWEQGAD